VFTQETFERLAEHEATSFWFRARNDLIAWAVRRYYPDAHSFLEVGCGTGYVLAGLRQRSPGLRLAGGDPFAAGLEIARRRLPDVDLFQLDGRRLPWEDEFDVVGAFDMLEHVEEDQQVLAELIRVVKPGGGALISVPSIRDSGLPSTNSRDTSAGIRLMSWSERLRRRASASSARPRSFRCCCRSSCCRGSVAGITGTLTTPVLSTGSRSRSTHFSSASWASSAS